jgi:hypothetical protein
VNPITPVGAKQENCTDEDAIAESTLQRHEECSREDAIPGVGTMDHADHDHVIDVGVASWMVEIKRDEVEKWSSCEKIDDARGCRDDGGRGTDACCPRADMRGVSGAVRGVACVVR